MKIVEGLKYLINDLSVRLASLTSSYENTIKANENGGVSITNAITVSAPDGNNGLVLDAFSNTNSLKGVQVYTNAETATAYNSQTQVGDQMVVNTKAGGGALVVGRHDGGSWRMGEDWITANRRVTVVADGEYGTIRVAASTNSSTKEASIGFFDGDTTSNGGNIWTIGYRTGGVPGFALYGNELARNVWHVTPGGISTIAGQFHVRDELLPVFDNNHALGSASMRFATAYFVTNPIVSSDVRLKTDIEEIPGEIASEIMHSLRAVTYRNIVGGSEVYDEDELFEEQVQVTEPVESTEQTIQIVDGKAVVTTVSVTTHQPVYDEYPMVESGGEPIMALVTPAVIDSVSGRELSPAVYEQRVYRVPRTVTVTKTRKVTKYRDVAGVRYHVGYIANELKAALDAVADRWPRAKNLAVWLLANTDDSDSIQMVRMEQMIPIIHAATVYQLRQ